MLGALKFLFLIVLSCIYSSGYVFFEIVEVMPNTVDDKNLEYIILKNISNTARSLSGYILADKKKQYIFTEDIFMQAGERKQFLRPQTKLVLNNSNEEIYLYNPERELIDKIQYKKSVKGEFLSFEEINIPGEDNIISAEVYISGEIYISDEVIIVDDEEIIVLEVPNVVFGLQRPSYMSQSGSTNIYTCDRKKEECKVNFDLRDSFSSRLPERNYICEIDFGIGVITGQEGRCNPNTIIFPNGEFEVLFKIMHEDDMLIFSEKKIFVKNTKNELLSLEKSEDLRENGGSDKGYGEKIKFSKIHIRKPTIIIQSGLTGKGRYFYCIKSECKINLNYEKKHKDERCFWNFAHNKQSSNSTHTRCNPGYVTLTKGIHDLSLRVYEKGNESNKKIVRFYVYNEDILKIISHQDTSFQDYFTKTESKLQKMYSGSIILQGTLSENKSLSGSILICSGVERCYVNLEGVIEEDNSDLEYTWAIDGEVFSEKLNPKGIWIEGPGEHEIVFQVGDLEKEFIVNIVASSLLMGENGESFLEKEQKLNFTQNFLVLKYDGLRISGKAEVGSRVEIYHAGEKILSGISNEKGKYRLVSKNLTAGEYSFDTKIILSSGEEIFIEKSGQFILKIEKRVYWFISKKKKSKKTKKAKIIKPSKLIMKAEVLYGRDINNIEILNIGTKIFLILMICLSAIFGTLHIISMHSGIITGNILGMYQLRYLTKQKVLLCL